jgi:hypothetical protein
MQFNVHRALNRFKGDRTNAPQGNIAARGSWRAFPTSRSIDATSRLPIVRLACFPKSAVTTRSRRCFCPEVRDLPRGGGTFFITDVFITDGERLRRSAIVARLPNRSRKLILIAEKV